MNSDKLLSDRLAAVLSYVKGRVLADIGTDHGFLPIAACLEGKVERGIACDVSVSPLNNAVKNIAAYDLCDKIETRLGFGLQMLKPGEADCVCIAGMGGMRIVEILQRDLEIVAKLERLVLQPQHDVPAVRHILHKIGFIICDETMLREGGHFYNVVFAENGENCKNLKKEKYTEMEYALGKCLMEKKDNTLYEYAVQELHKIERIREAMDRNSRDKGNAFDSGRDTVEEGIFRFEKFYKSFTS